MRRPATYTSTVDPSVATQLRDLNRTFYRAHAETFAATRRSPWPGWFEVPRPVSETASVDSVLDLGCGSGRYLAFLRAHGFVGRYCGLDLSGPLLRMAEQSFSDEACTWIEADVLDPSALDAADLPRTSSVVAWGVLHHIPGFDTRMQLLQWMRSQVAPGGSLSFSLWQPRSHARFASREVDPASAGIAPSALEPGDALLDWQGDRAHPRYCHHFSDEEIARIIGGLGDGRAELRPASAAADRYNAYLVWHSPGEPRR